MTNQVNKKSDSGILRALKATASLKVTVVCLVLLALLVVWGTLYQAEHGLYQAQQKFFHSWFFFIFGFIPFPGTVMVMFVLFFNLVTSLFFRVGFRLSNLGNIITHTGIIILFVGGFFTFYYSQESSLMMKEGETAAMSSSYNQWELALWERTGTEKIVYAVETGDLDAGESIKLDDLSMELQVLEYYSNCTAFTGSSMDGSEVINSSGIKVLKEKTPSAEAGENVAGLVLAFNAASQTAPRVLLYGRDSVPTPVSVNDRSYTSP